MKNAELRIVAASGTAAPMVPPSPRRRTLLLSPHNTATYTVGLNDHVALGAGITVTPTGGAVRLDFEDYGSFIQQELWVIASAAADIGVLEGVELKKTNPTHRDWAVQRQGPANPSRLHRNTAAPKKRSNSLHPNAARTQATSVPRRGSTDSGRIAVIISGGQVTNTTAGSGLRAGSPSSTATESRPSNRRAVGRAR